MPLPGSAHGPMYDFVVALIWATAAFFAVLLLFILVNKAWRELAARRRRLTRNRLEPAFFRYVVGTGPVEEYLDGPPRKRDESVIEAILLDLGRIVKGSAWDRAREAFDQLGLVERYIDRLDSRRWWQRAEAAEKLGGIGSDRATDPLVSRLTDPVAEVRVRVARALGQIGTNQALGPLVDALRDPGRWPAIRVAGILIRAGEPAARILLERFQDLPAHARLSAIDIFGRIRSLTALPLLLESLRDGDPDIRARAAHALGRIGDPNVASHLMAALHDESWAVRAMAARALGRLKEDVSVTALRDALGDPAWWVRANAAEALKNKGSAGRQALLEMLDSKDPYAAQQAVQMLQESGVLDLLIGQLSSAREIERRASLEVMAKLVLLERTDLLEEMACNHPEAGIRERLSLVLGRRVPASA